MLVDQVSCLVGGQLSEDCMHAGGSLLLMAGPGQCTLTWFYSPFLSCSSHLTPAS